MRRMKVIFATLLFFPCLTMFGLLMNYDLCYYCLHQVENNYSFKNDYKRNLFIKVPESNCKQNPPFLVILVTTVHSQKEGRMAIRKTWGKEQLIHGKRVVTFFVLGMNPGKPVSLSEEINTYNDMILKDFVDSYYNLTIKTLAGLDWVVHHCPQTLYVMKTDADMFVNTFYLVKLLLRKNQTSNLFTGGLRLNYGPIRNVFSKFYISKREYMPDLYPPFCPGMGYVLSIDVAQRIYNISSSIPYFKLEDVYIGMCLEKLKISLQELHTAPIFFLHKPWFSVCTYRNLVAAHGVEPEENILNWETLLKEQEYC